MLEAAPRAYRYALRLRRVKPKKMWYTAGERLRDEDERKASFQPLTRRRQSTRAEGMVLCLVGSARTRMRIKGKKREEEPSRSLFNGIAEPNEINSILINTKVESNVERSEAGRELGEEFRQKKSPPITYRLIDRIALRFVRASAAVREQRPVTGTARHGALFPFVRVRVRVRVRDAQHDKRAGVLLSFQVEGTSRIFVIYSKGIKTY